MLGSSEAQALTTPLPGATLFPSSHVLVLPFPAGNDVQLLSAYGPSMGSSLHDGVTNTSSANDYYALDLVYANEPNYGKGLPIAAPLAGTVVKAGWATAGWANYGQRVILRHDLGDGHIYHSLYAHLNAIDPAVMEGGTVAAGQVLGELGQSCQGALSCGSFSTPHLHWSIHRDSTIGGSGTGGSYGGNAVVPEPMDGTEDLLQGMIIGSTNTGMPVCGDGYCTAPETPESCPQDCPVCEAIPPAGRVVEESEALCFTRHGTPTYWHDESAGHGGSSIWTTASEGPLDNYGTWSLRFEQAGSYELEIFTDAALAQSQQAAYQVTHAGGTSVVTIDQTAADGWQSLGSFDFEAGDMAAGSPQRIVLEDVTGEPLSEMRQLVFDAVRVTGLNTGTGGAGSGGTSGSGGGTTGSGASSSGSGGDGSGGDAAGGDDGGCGCRIVGAPQGVGWAWHLALVPLLPLARRRRRRPQRP
ncbi:MAG: peptidoglycan DD-metalloendopeptidase family protein [Myxococcales bacterium]|nr:peptidoglycan DD-metalloendopeptidase family protein [Myxococcales bacterium]